MKILSKTVSVFALSLALAACGGGADETTGAAAPDADAMTPAAEGSAMGEAVSPEAAETVPATNEATPAVEAVVAPAAVPVPAAPATPVAPAAKPATVAPAAAPKVAATPPAMFAVCAACHSVEKGKDGIGPSLAGVFGSKAGQGSFEFSGAMAGSGMTWDAATLDRFLENPRGAVPGTTMAYNGLKNEAQRKAIVDYLKGV